MARLSGVLADEKEYMTYEQLHEFINSKMRMSHIYQPVMIKRLLLHPYEQNH
jgi:hypothetical protein